MDQSSAAPVACTLTTVDAAGQALEWTELRRHALTVERLPDGAAMTFAVERAAAVEDLAAREASCCGFLAITTTRGEEAVRLELTAETEDGRQVIDVLAGTGGR